MDSSSEVKIHRACGVVGLMKFNMAYRRFRHFGKDKNTMCFAEVAIAPNTKRMYAK